MSIDSCNKLREQAIKMATQFGHYVESVAEDLETVYAAGFEPAYKYRLLPKPLPKTRVDKVVRGPNTGTALAYIVPISRSNGKVVFYQLRYAAKKGGDIGEFTVIPSHVARFPILVKDLTPGTIYIFQARATNKVAFNDWSDPVSFMATHVVRNETGRHPEKPAFRSFSSCFFFLLRGRPFAPGTGLQGLY